MRRVLPQFDEDEYKNLTAGTTGAWKFVSRVTASMAVCLISRINRDEKSCRAELATNASSNKSILSHAISHHNFDTKKFLEHDAKQKNSTVKEYLSEKKFNEIWNTESAISRLVAKKGATLNFFQDNFVMDKLFQIAFKEKMPNKQDLRKNIMNHANAIKSIIKQKLKDVDDVTVSFDEWTSRSNIQIMNLIAHTSSADFNLGLIEVNTETATAENLMTLINTKLEEYDIKKNVKVMTADGAATNSKIARLMNLPIQLCNNHGIQLTICDMFYQKSIDLTTEMSQSNEDSISEAPETDDSISINDSVESIDEAADEETQLIEEADLHPQQSYLYDDVDKEYLALIQKIRKIAVKFHSSPKNQRYLKKYMNIKILLDVKTR